MNKLSFHVNRCMPVPSQAPRLESETIQESFKTLQIHQHFFWAPELQSILALFSWIGSLQWRMKRNLTCQESRNQVPELSLAGKPKTLCVRLILITCLSFRWSRDMCHQYNITTYYLSQRPSPRQNKEIPCKKSVRNPHVIRTMHTCLCWAQPQRTRLEPINCPCISCIALSASSFVRNDTNPYPLERPVLWSHMTRASLLFHKTASISSQLCVST